ncbi:uracil-DNA glycosylase [Varibaculum massiliense]|uniref:uracil-DNA glycosylase n=1 Tax=Varibaculum massiliense TaxID=1852372 RepID=UPI0008D9563F|nr:uracil-DNA glycosylase [Varibaculum massiliense]
MSTNLEKIMHPSWAEVMTPIAPKISEMGKMLRDEGNNYLPAGGDIFRAFTYPFNQVKVLIVGQDPYPTPGNAMGLSFSVKPGVEIPKSLKNIFKELHDDLGCSAPSSGDLRPWAGQGVMLLNRVLTVTPNEAGSHRGRGWEEVTDCAISALVARDRPLVAILWGKQAQSLAPALENTPIIQSAHPSPLSASRGFFGSRPFSRTNSLLQQLGASPVNWQLP